MVIGGITYTDRAEAADALLNARKGVRGATPTTVGSYRGLDIDISFDLSDKEYKLHLAGSTKQTVSMGESAGNIARLDNAIDRISEYLKSAEERLQNIYTQMEKAQEAIDKPFPQEAQYQEVVTRLAEVEAQLNAENKAKNEVEKGAEVEADAPAPAVAKDSTTQLFNRLNNPDKTVPKPPPLVRDVPDTQTTAAIKTAWEYAKSPPRFRMIKFYALQCTNL
jgi:hypothetical protein